MGMNVRTRLRRRRLRMHKPKVSVPVRPPFSLLHFSSPARVSYSRSNLELGPVCKIMTDTSPNSIFLSSAFEPSRDELRAFARTEKDRSRLARERKQERKPEKKPLLKAKPAPQAKPPPEIIELSSDEELPDFSQILSRTKQEGAPCVVRCPSECED